MLRSILIFISITASLLLGHESAGWHVGRGIATDGDTVKIGHTIFRLKGVRAPERWTVSGKIAKAFIRDHLIAGRWIACRETGQLTFSRYEAFCYAFPGIDIGAAMIRAGLACASADRRWSVTRYLTLDRSDHPKNCGFGA